ncbi:hypothetical protein KKP97_06585, partial [Methanothermococcus sp. SCGC AD-155-C09]|nr:hypothetical protein [Methanothermococcus sp. SCGC AD-155-C09]
MIIKELEKLSLRSPEIRVNQILRVRIDHSVLHFWEKKLSPYMEEIINMVLKKLHILTYSKSFIDSTII